MNLKLTAILVSLLTALPVAAAIFPDENLEKAVRQYVFEKRDTDEPITAEDVASISTITARSKGISDLTGLEHCKRLMLLELSGNEITDLSPIADLGLLQSLTLTSNKIEDISPLAELKRLQYIELSDNPISVITPISGLEALNSAYLSGNMINDISAVKNLQKLWTLDLADNVVSDLSPAGSIVRLSSLILDGNKVTSVEALSELTSLQRLSLKNNQIKDISILAEMAEKDVADKNRFARFWIVSLQGNPLNNTSRNKHVETLKKYSVRISFAKE